jgi:hypothetical protein
VQCRDLLMQRVGSMGPLEPYAGEGIDVPIKLGHPTHKFDVALRGSDGRLVVGECKRWADSVPQGQLAEFVHWVSELRRISNSEVAAFFFASIDPQLGLLQTAIEPNIRVVVYVPDQESADVVFSFVRFDPVAEARVKDAFAHLTATASMTTSMSIVVIRGDGSREVPA